MRDPSRVLARDAPALEVDIVVIGAGQAGLSAAYHLKRLGLAPVTGWSPRVRNRSARHRWRAVRQASAPMPPADHGTIRDPDVASAFLAMLAETFAQGPAGSQVDSALVASACGFDPADGRVPVRMWHGDVDENVPIEMAWHLADRIPGADLTVMPDEGHPSPVHRHLGRILTHPCGGESRSGV